MQVVPSAANVEAYAKLVQEKYYMRTLIGVAKSIISNSEKSDADARGLMEFAEQKLYEIRQGKDATGLVKVDRAIFELYDKLQRISGDDRNQYVGIPTGFSALDTITTDATPYQSGGVYMVGDTGFEMYNYVDSLAKNYADIVTSVADQLAGVSTVYAMAVPLSSGITLPDALYSDIPGSDQTQAEKDILAAMGNNVKTVPLHDTLMAHRGEYIYFRTDHHWTGLGAYYAYVQFCAAKGITPHSLSEYEVSQYDGFLGSFYNDGGKPDAMKNHPDTVTAYHPISTEARMQYGKTADSLTPGKVIYDESDAAAGLKYGTFIMGDNPYTVIENPDLSDGSKCIVVKESFGNAFVPFLVDHYQTVYVIDYRYYSGSVSALAKANGVTDVIFANNLSAIRGSYQVGKLAGVK